MKGKLKNITKVFKRYENKFLPIGKRLVAPDKKSEKFIDDYIRFRELIIQKKEKSDPLLHYKIMHSKFHLKEVAILELLNDFSLESTPDEEIERLKNNLIKNFPDIEKIELKGRDNGLIKLKDKTIKFSTITSAFTGIDKTFPHLKTNDRNGQCHMMSLFFTQALKADGDNQAVTGSVYTLSPQAKFLHSWLEFKYKDKEYCADNNYNIILSKEDYYSFFHPQVIQRLDAKTVENDLDMIFYLNDRSNDKTPYLKLYCVDREEAIEKYNKLLKNTSNNNPSMGD